MQPLESRDIGAAELANGDLAFVKQIHLNNGWEKKDR